MKKSVFLINCVWGGIVNEVVLVDVLKQGEIVGVVIDVLIVELFKEGNVLLEVCLLNLIIMLYSVWGSVDVC